MAQLPPAATLEIAGTGNMEAELREMVRSLRLDSRVRFAGSVTGKALSEVYSRAIAVVLPSAMPENCPMAVQEAMAMGRAVIGTNLGGIPSLVEDGATGYLVPPNRADELAAAMKRLLDNPDQAKKFGETARSRIRGEQYQREPHIRKLVELYETLKTRAGS
jgi:glycosyltransferase involved in cell wall biosynthesis